jgi:hypothetical protein
MLAYCTCLGLNKNSRDIISEFRNNEDVTTSNAEMEVDHNTVDGGADVLPDDGDGFKNIPEDMRKDVAFAHALHDIIGSQYVSQVISFV